ncbi:DUF4240 domain-containing protein [Streptomyces justiciae]|uniref:DUF4240 domain-containing protein n=1 Tax=Streptomyces justiciae TaxID=2780140 RepID=A0ABU3M309_9ACTN|nr:DUF4240 domain-containing protein [Streptomyces justiciae]MDT7845882.1 DUF4240 domain-containing protein [Streptomyces justiciae]
MNENTFWELIAECTPQTPAPDAEQLAATLTARLSDGPVTMVTGFAEQLSWALYRLDREEYEEWQRETHYSYETGSNAEGWATAWTARPPGVPTRRAPGPPHGRVDRPRAGRTSPGPPPPG